MRLVNRLDGDGNPRPEDLALCAIGRNAVDGCQRIRGNQRTPPADHVAIVVVVRRLDQNELEASLRWHKDLQHEVFWANTPACLHAELTNRGFSSKVHTGLPYKMRSETKSGLIATVHAPGAGRNLCCRADERHRPDSGGRAAVSRGDLTDTEWRILNFFATGSGRAWSGHCGQAANDERH